MRLAPEDGILFARALARLPGVVVAVAAGARTAVGELELRLRYTHFADSCTKRSSETHPDMINLIVHRPSSSS